jgi:MoxR-like ATPase
MEEGEKLISLHPENSIIATANTCGMGDDTGLYSQGTRIQNYAQINRFAMTVILDYLDAKQEQKILMNRFGGDIEEWEAEAIVKAINAVREAFVNGQLSAPLSTRDAINWAEKFCIWGNPQKSAKYCFVNRAPQEERGTLEGLVQRAFD